MFPKSTITIRVDIPALSALVAYLQDKQAQEVKNIETKLDTSINRLSTSTTTLDNSIPKGK